MNLSYRGERRAARIAEASVEAIARQEEQTRNDLLREENTALASKIITLKIRSDAGLQTLRDLANRHPDIAAPVRPFVTLKLTSEYAKQQFRELSTKPIIVEDDAESGRRVTADGFAAATTNLPVEHYPHESNAPVEAKSQPARSYTFHLTPKQPRAKPRRHNSSVPPANQLLKGRLGQTESSTSQVRIHPPTQQIIAAATNNREAANAAVQANVGRHQADADFDRELETSDTASSSDTQLSQPRHLDQENATEDCVPLDFNSVPHCSRTGEAIMNSTVQPTAMTLHEPYFTFDFLDLPPRDLPEHTSYRVGQRQDERLMKFQKPPNGWEGKLESPYNTDYSDPRCWSAPSLHDEEHVWRALKPTLRQYTEITGEVFGRDEAVLLRHGYMATYNHIHSRFTQWCFSNLGSNHQWIEGGKLTYRLFQLERWYGLLKDYEFAPNWPDRHPNSRRKVVQNPDCFACKECIQLNIFCHGHREDYLSRCHPCLKGGRECSKTLV